jgi:hypothetical protein
MKTRNTLNWLGLVIGLLCGLFWLTFSTLELIGTPGEPPWELGVGLSILVLTLVGRFFPRIGSPILIVIGLAGVVFFLSRPASGFVVALTLGGPMIVAGIFFLVAFAISRRLAKT